MSLFERLADEDNVSVNSFINDDLLNACKDIDESLLDKHEIQEHINVFIRAIRIENNDIEFRRQLIEKLCRLRIRLNEMTDDSGTNCVKGHELIKECENLNGLCLVCLKRVRYFPLPPIVRSALNDIVFKCVYCSLIVHNSCIDSPLLINCPKELFDKLDNEQQFIKETLILKICPEKGLSFQDFRCDQCNCEINFNSSSRCDYNGLYYCRNCHINNISIIPARVMHNWDLEPRTISIKSYLLLNYFKNIPILLNILDLNSMLYGLVEELYSIKKIRLDLCSMSKYIRQCKQPSKPKIMINSYIFDEDRINSYSIGDLETLNELQDKLLSLRTLLFNHITKLCEVILV